MLGVLPLYTFLDGLKLDQEAGLLQAVPKLVRTSPQCGGACLRLPSNSWWASGDSALPHCTWCLCVADSLGGGSGGPCFCPTPCNLTRYGKEISMVRIPNRGSARYLARKYNRNETYIRENFLVLDVFFEALTSEAMEQRAAYGLSALLGDLGGQMGLFIGASILTLLEILDYIYEVSWDRLKRAWRRPKTPLRTSTGGISTLGLQELKEQSPCPSRGCAEGGGASSLLPNHHHPHGPPGSLFEDFAC